MQELSLEGQCYRVYLDVFRQIFPRLKVLDLQCNVDSAVWREEQRTLDFIRNVQDTLERFNFGGNSFLLAEIAKLDRLRLKQVTIGRCERDSLLVEFCRSQPTVERLELSSYHPTSNKVSGLAFSISQISS